MLFLLRIIHYPQLSDNDRILYLRKLEETIPSSTYVRVGQKEYLGSIGLEITYNIPDDYLARPGLDRVTATLSEYVEKALGPIMEADKQLDYCIRSKKE